MKKRRWTAAAVAVMLLFTGCSFGTLKEQKTGEIEYEIVKKEEIPEKLKEEIADSYLFANGTGMGMKPLEGQTYIPDKSFLRPDLIVTDVVYAPRETALLKMAKEVGCKTMNGLGMMLFQGAAAFKLWTGKEMPIEHMKEVLNIRYDD